jgi:nucleoside-diphosphate-sugar epimerase
MARQLLVVGGGFVGSAVARAASSRPEFGRVTVVVRSSPDVAAADETVRGDARAVDLGLGPATVSMLRAETTDLVVAVGSTDIAMSPATAQAEHVAPVVGALAFARSCPALQEIVIVSSAMVADTDGAACRSDWIPPRGWHRNFYEWSKIEVERLARSSGLPVTIVRPGQVLGSLDGAWPTPQPFGLFEALPGLAAGWPLPYNPRARNWSVAVDVLAGVLVAACLAPPRTRATWCVHPESLTFGGVLDLLAVRHGLAPKRIASRRLASAGASVLRPRWLGVDAPRELLDYLHLELDLDLSCQRELTRAAGIEFGDARRSMVETMDHELARWRRGAW